MAAKIKQREQRQQRRELSEKAVAFYAQHNVQAALEKLLNDMFVAAPKDVYGYMSEYFSELSVAPVVCAASAAEGLDERGGRALDVSIHCSVHGVDKYITSVSVPILPHPPTSPSPLPVTTSPAKSGKKKMAAESQAKLEGEDEEEGAKTENKVVEAFKSFNTYITPKLLCHSPSQQAEIDSSIASLRDEDGREMHPSALLATSLAVAKSAALLTVTPLHQHLASTLLPSPQPLSFSLPTPVTSLLAGGCGKLRFREFCLTPLPGSVFSEQVSALSSVHRALGALLSAKSGVAGGATLLPSGAYCPVLDRAEAGLELVREAALQAGLALSEDLSVVIDVGADKLFDQDKCKYELVTGQWKTSQDVISLYSDLLTSHPGLLGFIDPLHPKDVEGWKKLHEVLGSKCLLVADRTFDDLPITPLRKREDKETTEVDETDEGTQGREEGEAEEGLDFLSCAGISLENTLSATCSRALSLAGCAHYVMLSVPPTLTVNPLLADLAVALQCKLLRLGAPVGISATCLLSRMLQIREELSVKGTYVPAKALVFSCTPISPSDDKHYCI